MSATPRALIGVGLVLMLVAALDPIEGSVLALAGGILVAVTAVWLHAGSRLQMSAAALMAAGVGALFGLTAIGGVGGSSGRSAWWALLCLPYPIGWILGVAGAARMLRSRTVYATSGGTHPER